MQRTVGVVPEAIEAYAARHTTPLPPLLEELQATTRARMGARAQMLSGHIEGTLLQFLAAAVGARRILELGTFTGFSALMLAAALPEDGQLITCEIDPEALAIARSFFARSPHGHKIAVTGEISIQGRIRPVGGIIEKLYAARQAGMRAIVIPRENARELDRTTLGLDVIPVATVQEALAAYGLEMPARARGMRVPRHLRRNRAR